MPVALVSKIHLWLRSSGIPVSVNYLDEKLKSHPDFPSLLSITDVLTEAGIETHAMVVDKERFLEIPVPFLAHVKEKQGDFVVVKNKEKTLAADPLFMEKWDGVIVIATKTTTLSDPVHNNFLQREQKQRRSLIILAGILIIIASAACAIAFNWNWLALLILSATGIGISVLLAQREIGIDNALADQLCSSFKSSNCDAVLHAAKPKLLSWLNFVDVCLIWFVWQGLSLITAAFIPVAVIPVLAILSWASLPVTLVSVYLQWRVIKKWCTLCLLVTGGLWLQAAVLLPVIDALQVNGIDSRAAGFLACLAAIVSLVWIVVLKPALQKSKELKDGILHLQRFKNDTGTFTTLLAQQRTIPVNTWEEDIQIGNPEAPLQLIMACGLYCNPCAKAHLALSGLAERGSIGLTIRFSVHPDDTASEKTIAVLYILQLLKGRDAEYKRRVLHHWYTSSDKEVFKNRYPLYIQYDSMPLARKHAEWSMMSGVLFTPTIFINGCELPKGYMATDLAALLNRMEALPAHTAKQNAEMAGA